VSVLACSPFFPLVQNGLHRVRRQAVGPIPDLELDSSQEFAVRFGHEAADHLEGLFLSLLADEGGQALGFGFLFGG
jgi:hypothetical protein